MEDSEGGYTMGVPEGGEKTGGTQRRMVVEWGLLYRDTQGSVSWPQVLIFRKVIVSWSWLVSLLGAGAMGVYIAYPILRNNYFGLQNM